MRSTTPATPDPVDYAAPRKYVLVVSCMDARLLDDLVRFLDHDNLTNRYYHLTFAGTAMGLTDRVKDDLDDPAHPPAPFDQWRQTFVNHFQAAVLLTKGALTDVYIVQHEDCGAFREYLGKDAAEMTADEELQLHEEYSDALLEDVVSNFCTTYNPTVGKPAARVQKKRPSVHTFYMDLRGGVKHLRSWAPPKGEEGSCSGYRCYCPPEDETTAKDKPAKKKPRK
jgi:hypothetical protein